MCVGFGFGFQPAFLAGVLGSVCFCAAAACTPPILAEVCRVGVCLWARVSAAPRHSWLRCWGVFVCMRVPPVLRHSWLAFVVCGFGVAWHLSPCHGLLRVVFPLRVCGTRWLLMLGTCPCVLVVAGGLPLWRASWPRVVRCASSGPVSLNAPVGFPDTPVPFPGTGAFPPGFTGLLRGARGGRPRTGIVVPAAGRCRGRGAVLAPRRTRSGPRDGVVPGGSLRRRSWGSCATEFCVCGPGPSRVWIPVGSVIPQGTWPVHRGCFMWTPTPPVSGRRTPRPGPVRARVCRLLLARSGGPASRARFGAPHLFLWPVLVLSLFARPPPGCACPVSGCCCVLFFFFFPFSAPLLSPAFCVFWPGVPLALASCLPPPLLVFFFFFFLPHPLPPPVFFACLSGVFFPPAFPYIFVRCCVLPCCSACAVPGWFACPGLWVVFVYVAVGVVPRQGTVSASAVLFGAPWLCLFSVCWILLCCACLVLPCSRHFSSPCCLWCPACVLCPLVLFCGACALSLPLGAVVGLPCCAGSC